MSARAWPEERLESRSVEIQTAIEYGGSDVRVRISWLKDRSGFCVKDSGPGIDPDDWEAVLEPGYTTSDDGTGYGLEIVRSIVEAHGWKLAIEAGGPDVSIPALTAQLEKAKSTITRHVNELASDDLVTTRMNDRTKHVSITLAGQLSLL